MQITHGIPGRAARPMALTVGNFDGVHLGHQEILRELIAAARAAGLDAGVLTFEPHPREYFAPDQAPTRLTSLREKLEIFAALGLDRAHVCRFDRAFAALGAEEFVERLLVDALQTRVLLIGDDFRFGRGRSGDLDLLRRCGERHGYTVRAMHSIVRDGLRVSSTAVREALAAGDAALAQRLLGRPYSISGRVVHGDKKGRELGFPTANIQLRHNRPPLFGIYAVEVHGAGPGPLPGAASLGVRPTVRAGGAPTLEVHILDFAGELYERHLRLDFLAKLRDEERYPDLEALRRQIARDVERARDFFRGRAHARA